MEGKMIKNRYTQMILFILVFIAIWNLCELISGTFITHSGYIFTWADNIAKPAGLALVIGLVMYVLPGSSRGK